MNSKHPTVVPSGAPLFRPTDLRNQRKQQHEQEQKNRREKKSLASRGGVSAMEDFYLKAQAQAQTKETSSDMNIDIDHEIEFAEQFYEERLAQK